MTDFIEVMDISLMCSYSWGESLLRFAIDELAEIHSSERAYQLRHSIATLNDYSLKSPLYPRVSCISSNESLPNHLLVLWI